MPKPKRVYYVEQSGADLRYGQKGGGLMARLSGATDRRDTMVRQGGTAKIYYADVVWKEIEDVEVERP